MTKAKDLSNARFGRLTALHRVSNTAKGGARWVCQCECGGITEVATFNLTGGKVLSCGCLRREHIHRTHKLSGTRTYKIWAGVIQRCTNPNNPNFDRYGGRGIKVCERWLQFENFLADMGEAPPKLTIERNDNDGDYEPSNCRWATREEQGRNKKGVVLVDGKTLKEWASIKGMKYTTFYKWYRLIGTVHFEKGSIQ